MRDRHTPRVCRACRAPLACQEDRCWRCGALVVSESPRSARAASAGGQAGARRDAGRMIDEGGRLADGERGA